MDATSFFMVFPDKHDECNMVSRKCLRYRFFVGLELGSFYSIFGFLCGVLSTIIFFCWLLHGLSGFGGQGVLMS